MKSLQKVDNENFTGRGSPNNPLLCLLLFKTVSSHEHNIERFS